MRPPPMLERPSKPNNDWSNTVATFRSIPTARIVSTVVAAKGRNEDGRQVRYVVVETTDVTYVQRFVDGKGMSTTQFGGSRRSMAQAHIEAEVSQEQLTDDEPEVEAEPVAEAQPEQPARRRGPNRPDAEQQVWGEGDLAVVMVQGRRFAYDLRRAGETVESVAASRNWRQERRALIERAAGMLAAA